MRAFGCSAVYRAMWKIDQRFAGAGNGDAAAGAAAGFGLFGRIGFLTLGGGTAGFSSANIGVGSMIVLAGVAKSPGFRITWTGIVTGWNLGRVKVTVNPVGRGR
jgi:hypothetical protein